MTALTQKQYSTVPLVTNEDELAIALEIIYDLMNKPGVELGTPEGNYLEQLSILVEAYEKKHYPIPKADPLDVIRYLMEQSEIDDSRMAQILGARSRKSEILSGKRKLSLAMIRRLHKELGIPAEILIQEY